ncbi:MAG: PAS domain S-box protein, partial [Planctomycetes bacterium]|nr:PAS domain S-box protein [Planctomycetota bacterium]
MNSPSPQEELERLRADNARLRDLMSARKPAAPAEGRSRKMLEQAWDVVLLHDASGQVSYANTAVTRVLGYAPDELVGSRLAQWVHPDDRDSLHASLYSIARQQGASTVVRYRARHARGNWRWLEAAHTNLLHDDSVAAVVAVCRDVSDRVSVEEELRQK